MTIVTEGPKAMEFHAAPSLDLHHLFEKVIRIWGVSRVRNLGPASGDPVHLSLERMVTFSGAVRGFLVVRSTREFALWLRSRRENTVLGRYPEEEIFEELVSLFCLYLAHSFWKPNLFNLGPIHPFPSIPQDWPEVPPRDSAKLQVEDFPLEVRFWMEWTGQVE